MKQYINTRSHVDKLLVQIFAISLLFLGTAGIVAGGFFMRDSFVKKRAQVSKLELRACISGATS